MVIIVGDQVSFLEKIEVLLNNFCDNFSFSFFGKIFLFLF